MALRGKDGKWLVGSLAKAADEAQYNFLMSTVPKQKAAARTLKDFGYAYVNVGSPANEQKAGAEEKDEPTKEAGSDASKPSPKTALKTIADPSKGFQWLGQKHYDGMGLAVIEDIYHRLEKDYALGRVMVPLSAEEERDVVDHRIIPVVASTCTTAASTATVALTATNASVAPENNATAVSSSSPATTAAATSASQQHADNTKSKSNTKIKMTRGVEPRVPIFMSPDALTADTLLLVMQGSGAVRPGMWARSVCFNDCLENGTIFPYLERAKARGWGVIVTNPNENTAALGDCSDDGQESPAATDAIAASELIETKGKRTAKNANSSSSAEEFWLGTTDASWKAFAKSFDASLTPVRGSESPMDHSRYVYNTFITSKAAKAKHILIVAHSFGGICVGSLLRDDSAIRKDMFKKCRAVAFTDACNDVKSSDLPEMKTFYKNNVINWVASKRTCDAPMGRHRYSGCEERSAGHDTHEWTSAACVEPVFKFLDSKLEVAVNGASN